MTRRLAQALSSIGAINDLHFLLWTNASQVWPAGV